MTLEFQPHVTVACVVERDNRFLMVEELIQGEYRFNQPAGHLEANESLTEAARRETLEETAWTIDIIGFLGVCVFQAKNGITYIRHTFAARPLTYDAQRPLDTGIITSHWLNRSEIQTLGNRLRSPMIIPTIDQYLANQIYPLAMVTQHR